MLRVPICSMSAYSATSVDVVRVDDLGDDRQAGLVAHVGEDLAGPASPSPWKAYGEVRGLKAPPRSSVAPAALAICGGLERLLGRLDRARPGDERERVRADRHAADPDGRALGVVLRG